MGRGWGLCSHCAQGAHIQVRELVTEMTGSRRRLAQADRVAYDRSRKRWEELVGEFSNRIAVEPYLPEFSRVALWTIQYVKARPS